ncbi:MAG: FAD-dependent oxidoreductase [Fusobacteria bacterium]|nr:FAD-dependent oxidoreductase [Fusobacteriota bacterium]
MKVLIVGGVAGGATFAARFRRLNESAEIIMFEKGKHISFANCGLPYHIGDVIKSREELLLQTPATMKGMFNLDVRIEQEITAIDKVKKEVEVKNLATGEIYKERYDKLILSPGASPIKPPIPGINSKHIFTLRNVTDMDKIIASMKSTHPKRAVIIGGGFIGVEVAENLHDRGMKVTIVEMLDQLMGPIDKEMSAFLHQHIKDKNVELYLKNGVATFSEKDDHTVITLQDGTLLKADLIILSIGVAAETKLAKEAGLTLDRGIIVNEKFQTSDENIYAVGDAIVVKHYLTGEPTMIPLAWPANRQARILADIISGKKASYPGTLGTSILKAFDLTIAATGLNEKILIKMGKKFHKVYTSDNDHAGYYPGATKMTTKLLFDEKGAILGAQIVGINGVDKRIDVIATAIKGKLSVYDLQNIEVAYAPPFSSAKDPVNIAGYVASNVLEGDLKLFYIEDLDTLDMSKTQIIDVREPEIHELGSVNEAINIPLKQLRASLNKLDKSKTIIVQCQTGKTSYFAYTLLQNLGYDVRNLAGGYNLYSTMNAQQDNPGIFNFDALERTLKKTHHDVKPQTEKNNVQIKVDACGLNCPGPIIKVFENIKNLSDGEVLEVTATDLGFTRDIKAWAEKTGNEILYLETESGVIKAQIKKKVGSPIIPGATYTPVKDGQTLVVFSNDLDKAIATFIIANGGITMGKKVTLFFTFWGLSILRKENSPKTTKRGIHKMFGAMMPKGSLKLPLSKMNFAGMGPKMIRGLMNDYNVPTLHSMIATFIINGGKIMACQMSMELMGITREELIDGIEVGGVATYLSATDNANLNLFI